MPPHDTITTTLSTLLGVAWLLPLVSFTLILFFGKRMGHAGIGAGYVALGAIGLSCLLSLYALFGVWLPNHPLAKVVAHEQEHSASAHAESPPAEGEHSEAEHGAAAHANAPDPGPPPVHFGEWYTIGQFGKLKITIGYYIDAMTILMFAMVTFIASCIHCYAIGYMHDELHEIVDHEVTLSDGHHLHRPGRFYRFFQYLSLFCFSMLGLVVAGNVAMVFVFWELVGICSYFLIGFYIERKSASNAANKAFIVNRVGDFGMLIGLMALFGSLGTFTFGGDDGLFAQIRTKTNNYQIAAPDGMVKAAASPEVAKIVDDHLVTGASIADAESQVDSQVPAWRAAKQKGPEGFGRKAYWLLLIGGLGIFCGCVGKSAQFPLHVWLPDAMEGPTPVSALVHSATMVAAGVYLVGRCYPIFVPEALLTIAIIGCITLFMAATIACTATDIKRVLAYSTVSQLGYMMLALGVGGWLAGMLHLVTHAFFKSLLFLCSGSVIHAVHTNEMPLMGGLRKKMPWTAGTMLIGCLAGSGAGIPFVIGFSGYHSKDAIMSQAMSFTSRANNPVHAFLLYAFAGGAAITAFYLFRLWYLTFAGEPRDHHRYDHAHESPWVMVGPLVALATLATAVAWPIFGLQDLIEQGRPTGTLEAMTGQLLTALRYPSEHDSHHFHNQATLVATFTALSGFTLATLFFGLRWLDAGDVRKQFAGLHRFLVNKWYFDELYRAIFVQPVMFISRRVAGFDINVIDRFINRLASGVLMISLCDDFIDRYIVDGLVNWTARRVHGTGIWLRKVQTGQVRQYVMFIALGTVSLFLLISFVWQWYVGV